VKSLRHIVLGFEGSMIPPRDRQPRTEQAARARAEALIVKLRGGADFAQVAMTESDDLETGARGGSIGPMGAGQLPPEIESVVSKLQPGQVSQPVRTQLGWHIFSIGTPTFEELRPMLMQSVQQQVVQEEVKRLEAQSKVELDPSFFPAQPAVPPPATGPGSGAGTAPPPRG
jgi:peptidyl-prolyl cis-trans isomerase C